MNPLRRERAWKGVQGSMFYKWITTACLPPDLVIFTTQGHRCKDKGCLEAVTRRKWTCFLRCEWFKRNYLNYVIVHKEEQANHWNKNTTHRKLAHLLIRSQKTAEESLERLHMWPFGKKRRKVGGGVKEKKLMKRDKQLPRDRNMSKKSLSSAMSLKSQGAPPPLPALS